MDYSQKTPKRQTSKTVGTRAGSALSVDVRAAARASARRSAPGRTVFDRSLTTYKEVVYNFQEYQKDYDQIQSNIDKMQHKRNLWKNLSQKKIIHYGLTQDQFDLVEKKLYLQRRFLNLSYLYDKVTTNTIPLRDLIISANHSPHRYYAEVQNRVNTLVENATDKGLVPLFMTITLPSQYHPFKFMGKKLVENPKYDGTPPREAVKALTRRFAKLRNDRALRDIPRTQRIYFRVNEPHQSGTPHTHILYYVPADRVERLIKAFHRLFPEKGNDIQQGLRNAAAYVMKYINKTLPKSKSKKLSKRDKYLNAWYSHHRITRFSSSRTLAPLYLYRLLHDRYTLKALTRVKEEGRLRILCPVDNLDTVAEIFDGEELIYMRNDNFSLEKSQG